MFCFLFQGFSKSVSLENLSLANCPISDEGLEGMYIQCETPSKDIVLYVTSILHMFQLSAKVWSILRASER